jgi:uncharacterized membrane protein YgdD (TMEM256/DUF423 family)
MPLRSPLSRATLVAGCIAGGTAVALGAFAAHALRTTLDGPALATWQTGVDYQFRHALALLVVGLLARGQAGRGLGAAAIAFGLGIVLFCASLYALALGAPRWLGAVTPIGGLCFLAGWSLLLASILRRG